MKLLLDENLSRRIVPFLQTISPALHKLPYLGWRAKAILKSGNKLRKGGISDAGYPPAYSLRVLKTTAS